MYRQLDAARIVDTLATLERRIGERFPDAGLRRVAHELLGIARTTADTLADLRRPRWLVRAGVGVLTVLLAGGVVRLAQFVASQRTPDELTSTIQAIESAVNEVVFVGVAIAFLWTLEGRLKRRVALRALHELRSVAHIVDMHQLTKDPEQFSPERTSTPSSPVRAMTRAQLSRYLDYCSELLSVTSKLAALYAQQFDDPVVLGAVNDVQALANGLSNKIWQKIIILDAARA